MEQGAALCGAGFSVSPSFFPAGKSPLASEIRPALGLAIAFFFLSPGLAAPGKKTTHREKKKYPLLSPFPPKESLTQVAGPPFSFPRRIRRPRPRIYVQFSVSLMMLLLFPPLPFPPPFFRKKT